MILMGFDQSLTGSGITIRDGETFYYYLLETFKRNKTKCPTIDYTRRLISICDQVEKIIDDHKPEYILMEGMSFGSTSSIVFDLGGLSHLARAMFLRKGIPFIIAPPKTVKKYFTGNGNAKKLDMIKRAEELGANIQFLKRIEKQTVMDDNVVDSFAMCCMLYDILTVKDSEYLDKVERSVDL
jgi:Holliday junction resolvasome RuvABC endonuclease subunit